MHKAAKKITTVSEKLFYKYSFSNVGVDTIRDESGCSKTTLYNNFGNKENLIAEVLKSRDVTFKTALENYIGEELSGLAAVSKIFEWHRDWFLQAEFNGCLFVRAASELHQPTKAIRQTITEHKEWLRNFIQGKLTDLPDSINLTNQIMLLLEGLISVHLTQNCH